MVPVEEVRLCWPAMPPRRLLLLLTILLLMEAPSVARADDEHEARMRAELEAMAPEALDAYDRGWAARESGDYAAALAAYEEVHRLAPEFSHALRRMCLAELELDRIEAGRAHCREAAALADIPSNQVALARALLTTKGTEPSREALSEAERLLARAVAAEPNEAYVHGERCNYALLSEHYESLGDCSSRLIELEPDSPFGYYFRSLYFGFQEDVLEAERQLDEAESRGMPPKAVAHLRGVISEAMPVHLTAWKWTKALGVPWVLGLVALMLLGFALSALTMANAKRSAGVASAKVSGLDALLRKVYAAVLWMCCAYYYLSLPLVVLMVLGAAGGVIYGFLVVGHVPIKLLVLVLIVAFVSVGAVLKGLLATFTRQIDEDPGEMLNLAEHPRLRSALVEVARKVGTRPVDNVYLDVDATIAVMERGGVFGQMRGRSERCLLLGVAALDGMKVGELKAILAHEYGHFQNEDTAGGGFALAVRRSMITMAISLAQSGAAAWYNPAWLFFRGFYWVFMRVSQGASRLQEILADRWAALAYGSDTFVRGLRHAIRRAVEFDAHVGASFKDVMEKKCAVQNLYTYAPTEAGEVSELEQTIEEVWTRPPNALDSHPCPKDRETWVRAMNVAAPDDPQAGEEAWSLLSDREAIQLRMTGMVRENVLLNHGVDIHRPGGGEVEA